MALARKLFNAALFGALLVAAQLSEACSWEGLTPTTAERLVPQIWAESQDIVRAKVVSIEVRKNHGAVARIQVLDTYKGSGSLIEIESPASSCQYDFRSGEEKIFAVFNQQVHLPTVYLPDRWLIQRLQSLKVSKRTH